MKQHRLSVKQIRKETPNAISLELDIPNSLAKEFEFSPGQYLSLESEIKGEKVRRSYSLCTAPHEDSWQVCVKKIDGGKFSTFANDNLKVGDSLDVLAPSGNFVIKELQDEGSYVFFAAGSGITPIISQIKHVLNNSSNADIVLFYGNRDSESIIFKEELEGLKNLYLNRISLHYILSKEMPSNALYSGRINKEKCEAFGRYFFDISKVNEVFLCGPSQMIFEIEESLIAQGLAKNKIKYELFTTADIVQPVKKERSNFDPTRESKISVNVDGLKLNFTLPYGGENILDAALENGADLPYSCKGGVCSTCKAKVLQGEVDMKVNYALDDDEVESGYVLACQSHPRSEEVEIDFDV